MKTTLSTGTTSVPKQLVVVGFRFHPTDKELLNYLRHKNLGHEVRAIKEVNICKFEPWDLPDQSYIKSDEGIWYFFCPREFKYSKSKRSNRTTEKGYWKPTGKPRPVTYVKKQIGSKKTLVFHHGRPKGTRTEWVIHEYDFCASSNLRGNFVLCRLKRKTQEIGQDQPAYYETAENERQNKVTEMPTDEGGHSSLTTSWDSMDQVRACASTPLILLGDGVRPSMAPSNLESISIPTDFENQTSVAPTDLENQMSHCRQSFPLTMTPSNLENLTSIAPSNIESISTPSNLENQTLMTPSNLENQISMSPSNPESTSISSLESTLMSLINLENQMSFCGQSFSRTMAPSNLENELWFCSEAIPPVTTASNLESYTPVIGEGTRPTVVPRYLENLSSYLKDDSISISDFENCLSTFEEGQCSLLVSPLDSYEKGDCVLSSNFHNQNLAYGEYGLSPMANPLTFEFESPDEKGDCLFISDLEIPTQNFDSEVGERSPVLVGSSDSNNQPIFMDNFSMTPLDFERQISQNDVADCCVNPPVADPSSFHESELVGTLNSEEKADIPVTQDGVSSSLKLPLPEFKNQNTNETSPPEEDYWSFLMSLDLEGGKEQATITELQVNLVTAPECNFGSEDGRPTFCELSPWRLWDW